MSFHHPFLLFLMLAIYILTVSNSGTVESYPLPRTGFCPSGYHTSGNYCIPNNRSSGAAVMRDGFCPSGYHSSGNYCLANNLASGKAIFRNGFCPSGYHASGKYCVEN
jgi:hypothetical protein